MNTKKPTRLLPAIKLFDCCALTTGRLQSPSFPEGEAKSLEFSPLDSAQSRRWQHEQLMQSA